MACPFFEPRQALPPGAWAHRPRSPLGESYSGHCHASGEPAEDHGPDPRNHELCNYGYARGLCDRFPASSQSNCALADAVRFSIICEKPLRLVYILEKDHAPMEHGELDSRLLAPNEILAAQARAFLASHARLRSQGL